MLIYLSGDWDVHWGYDLGVDPWPFALQTSSPAPASSPRWPGAVSTAGPVRKMGRVG